MPKSSPPPEPPHSPEPVPAAEKPPLRTRFRRLLFRPRVLLLFATAVSSAVAVPLLVRSLPDLRQRPEYQLVPENIRITDQPHWVPADLVTRALDLSDLDSGSLSLLDESLGRQLHEAFARHPWVAQVIRVRKVPPQQVEVELVYRRPVAMVEVQAGMYPVDPDGTLLPPDDFSVADTKAYPLIQNVASTPQGPAGTNWGDVAVLGAARLAEALLQAPAGQPPHWHRLNLAAIRVPTLQAQTNIEDVSYELISAGGSRIIWGRAPGSTHPGELSVEQKIGRLDKYVHDFGGFDRPHGPYEIDIRHWQEISRRPLTASAGTRSRR